ncbi:MAG TPA: hypothetical protein VGR28_14900, partial [Candidatus Thermoplasmatota archaeon]|nr:hypothetical protein [Candidatus Thermoplasmatota archaeon]
MARREVMRPARCRGPAAALAAVLLALALAGCVAPPDVPGEAAAVAPDPAPPPGARALLTAARLGLPLPLEALADDAERAQGIELSQIALPPGDAADLAPALLDLLAAEGRAPSPSELLQLKALADVPSDLAGALARLARAALDAHRLAQAAYAGEGVDWGLALRAHRLKLAAVEATLPALERAAQRPPGGSFEVCGAVELDLTGADSNWTCDVLLLVDLGGDDHYANNAGGTYQNDGSMLAIDVAGDDLYDGHAAAHHGKAGGAFRGLGMLLDLAGDDTYNYTTGEGAGVTGGGNTLGIGLLADLGGTDVLNTTGDMHSALNGGSWGGLGQLLLRGGDDLVEASALTSAGVNGGAVAGNAMLLAMEGARTYRANISTDFGGAANGASFAFGGGLLVDDGGSTRYEAWMGNTSSANGGSNDGRGALYDYGQGDDTYFARSPTSRSALNGAGQGRGFGVLWDDGGRDAYDDIEGVAPQFDKTIAPKGKGAQLDRERPASLSAGEPRRVPGAEPLVGALGEAAQADWSPASLQGLALALAGEAPRPLAQPRPADLVPEVVALAPGITPADLAALARLPSDLQDAVAELLAAHRVASAAAARAGDDAARGDLLAARGSLLTAVEAARPVLQRYASARLMAAPVAICPALMLDLTGAAAEHTCNYYVQISLGGDTVYRNHAGGNLHPGSASLLVDAGGNDQYLGPDDAGERFMATTGGAYVGLGMLVDYGGDDLYAPPCSAQSCIATGGAIGGAGALLDYGGHDRYLVGSRAVGEDQPVVANGGATVGDGFLADLGGHDTYWALGVDNAALNGGATFKAAALLFDREGDDLYHSEAGIHSASNGGALDGSALLLDLGGDDAFWGMTGHHGVTNGAGFAAAAPGAWLIDAGGDDNYTAISEAHVSHDEEAIQLGNGRYYMPGTCARPPACSKGSAALLDLGGRDAYLEWTLPDPSMPADMPAHEGMQGNGTMPEPDYDRT